MSFGPPSWEPNPDDNPIKDLATVYLATTVTFRVLDPMFYMKMLATAGQIPRNQG